jgi:hypothetical protein
LFGVTTFLARRQPRFRMPRRAVIEALTHQCVAVLVARWIGIVSATGRVISAGGCSADSSGSDPYCHPTTYGCTTINPAVINTAMIGANAAHSNAPSVGESVS